MYSPRVGQSLLQLPCELLVEIQSWLSPDDLCSLRLTCRHIETTLFPGFSKEFFTERRFMITEHSLQTLLDISRSRLAPSLAHLIVGLERLDVSHALPRFSDYWDPVSHTTLPAPPVKEGVNASRLDDLMVEQHFLLSSGQLQLMLFEVLQGLLGLEAISLQNTVGQRHCVRPGSSDLLVSYGAALVRRETGVNPTNLADALSLYKNDRITDIVFSAVLFAVARAGVKLGSLTVQTRGRMGLTSASLGVPRSLLDRLRPAIEDLQSLDLSVTFSDRDLSYASDPTDELLPWNRHHVLDFLGQTLNLVCLRIASTNRGAPPDGIMPWFSQLMRRDPRPLGEAGVTQLNFDARFKYLRTLSLEGMASTSATLSLGLLCLRGSLRSLSLNRVGLNVALTDEDMSNGSIANDSFRNHENVWCAFFRGLAVNLSLTEFYAEDLRHHPLKNCRHPMHLVVFAKSALGTQQHAVGKIFAWGHTAAESSMGEFLMDISRKVYVMCDRCSREPDNVGYWTLDQARQV